MRAAGNKEYGPGGKKSSIRILSGMVFRRVRGGGLKQGIWAGRRREAKIIDLDTFRCGFPWGSRGLPETRNMGRRGVGTRKSSIWIRLAMVFRMVREGGQKQGIWAGRHRDSKIIDLDRLGMVSIRFVRAVRSREYGPGGVGRQKSSIWIRLGMIFRRVREGGQK